MWFWRLSPEIPGMRFVSRGTLYCYGQMSHVNKSLESGNYKWSIGPSGSSSSCSYCPLRLLGRRALMGGRTRSLNINVP